MKQDLVCFAYLQKFKHTMCPTCVQNLRHKKTLMGVYFRQLLRKNGGSLTMKQASTGKGAILRDVTLFHINLK